MRTLERVDLRERLAVFGYDRLQTAQEIQDFLGQHHIELELSATYEGFTRAYGIYDFLKSERYVGTGSSIKEAMNDLLLTFMLHNQ